MLALTRAPPSLRGRRSWLSRITAMTVIAPSSSYAASESFDVIVVGGGHAGCEAALTCARLGLSTALFALNLDRIAWQPCNPAVGGPAKSQLVHEVDALGGVIGRLADATALQKRILNASRGPAVWALRAQTDKRQYARQMLQLLQHTPNLALREAMVTGLEVEDQQILGVRTYFGSVYAAPAVILTTGTFLGGQIWVGNQSMPAGRAGEQPAEGIHLMHQLALGRAAHCRVAGLPGDAVEVEGKQGRGTAQAGCRDRRFTAGMAAAHHDHIKVLGARFGGDARSRHGAYLRRPDP